MSLEACVVAFASRGLEPSAEPEAPPSGTLLPPRLRRGTSVTTRLVADLVEEIARAVDLRDARFVLGSAFGEIGTAFALLRMRHEHDGALSPARFTLSVHSAPLSVLGIALADRAPSTAIAAGPCTFAMALVEGVIATSEVERRAPATGAAPAAAPVVVVVADEPPPDDLRAGGPAAAAVALALAPPGGPGRSLRVARTGAGEGASAGPSAPLAARELLAALRVPAPARVGIGADAGASWIAELGGSRDA